MAKNPVQPHSTPEPAALLSALKAMLKDHQSLNLRLVEVPFDWKTDVHRLSGKFYYIQFSTDGVPTLPEFVEYLFECLIPFCLPKKKYIPILEKANPTVDYPKILRLGEEAKSLFIRAKSQITNGGEPGELILYVLLEWALRAPRMVSKMYMKTNSKMPVHGTDGLHLGYDAASDQMTIYFGESKIFEKFSDAASSAFSSIADLINNTEQVTREIEILNNLSDIETVAEPFRSRIFDYINPYSNSAATLNKCIVHACLLGFEYSAYKRILKKSPSEIKALFEKQYRKRIASACRVIERHYGKKLPVTTNLHLFLLPFPSMKDLRKLFYSKIGVEK